MTLLLIFLKSFCGIYIYNSKKNNFSIIKVLDGVLMAKAIQAQAANVESTEKNVHQNAIIAIEKIFLLIRIFIKNLFYKNKTRDGNV